MGKLSLENLLKEHCDSSSGKEVLGADIRRALQIAIDSGYFVPKEIDSSAIEDILKTLLVCTTEHQNIELEDLILEKEKIERAITKKSEELQEFRKTTFEAFGKVLQETQYGFSSDALSTLHNLKLQNLDILEVLKEVSESAIVTTLEKSKNSTDIHNMIVEISKNLTLQTLSEGILSSIRIRKVLNSILDAAIEVSEATPLHAKEIISATVHGTRKGLIYSIARFKERFENTPDEAKKLLLEDMQILYEDLHHADVLFMQTLKTKATDSSALIGTTLSSVINSTSEEMDELIAVSREAVELMRDKLSFLAKQTLERSTLLKERAATESKRLGIRIWERAKATLEEAFNGAKEVLESSKEHKDAKKS